jgi:hypothetical protein
MMSASESTPTLTSWLVFNPSRDAQRALQRSSATTAARLVELAPYAAILILPGGSLMALLLWLHRRQKRVTFLPSDQGIA